MGMIPRTIKIFIFLSLFISLLVSVSANDVYIEYSSDNTTWKNITYVNQTQKEGYQIMLQEGTTYYFRARNSTTQFSYTQQKTKYGGKQEMTALAVFLFVMFPPLLLGFLSFFLSDFFSYKPANVALKGSLILLALFFMVQATAVVASLSEEQGYSLSNEIYSYLDIFVVASYVTAIIIFVVFFLKVLQEIKLVKHKERFGDDEE